MLKGKFYICTPQWIWKFGPIEIDFSDYLGPCFYMFGRAVYPRPLNPLWFMFRIAMWKNRSA